MKKNKTSDSYEKLFIELENIVEKMDSGSISLERSLELFEKGMDLIKDGKNKLTEAEIKVKTIMKTSDDQILKE
tara:strand:- start:268 stop:489 length:222 start_codon:yes stop_codon:yes gene_type:complete